MAQIKVIRDEDKDEIIQEAYNLLIATAALLEACDLKSAGKGLRKWVERYENPGVE